MAAREAIERNLIYIVESDKFSRELYAESFSDRYRIKFYKTNEGAVKAAEGSDLLILQVPEKTKHLTEYKKKLSKMDNPPDIIYVDSHEIINKAIALTAGAKDYFSNIDIDPMTSSIENLIRERLFREYNTVYQRKMRGEGSGDRKTDEIACSAYIMSRKKNSDYFKDKYPDISNPEHLIAEYESKGLRPHKDLIETWKIMPGVSWIMKTRRGTRRRKDITGTVIKPGGIVYEEKNLSFVNSVMPDAAPRLYFYDREKKRLALQRFDGPNDNQLYWLLNKQIREADTDERRKSLENLKFKSAAASLNLIDRLSETCTMRLRDHRPYDKNNKEVDMLRPENNTLKPTWREIHSPGGKKSQVREERLKLLKKNIGALVLYSNMEEKLGNEPLSETSPAKIISRLNEETEFLRKNYKLLQLPETVTQHNQTYRIDDLLNSIVKIYDRFNFGCRETSNFSTFVKWNHNDTFPFHLMNVEGNKKIIDFDSVTKGKWFFDDICYASCHQAGFKMSQLDRLIAYSLVNRRNNVYKLQQVFKEICRIRPSETVKPVQPVDINSKNLYKVISESFDEDFLKKFSFEKNMGMFEAFFHVPSLGIFNQADTYPSYLAVVNRNPAIKFPSFDKEEKVPYSDLYDNHIIVNHYIKLINGQFKRVLDNEGRHEFYSLDIEDYKNLSVLYQVLKEMIPTMKKAK